MKLIEYEQDYRNKMRYEHIGNVIRTIRKEKGWTQITLAEKAGVHHSIVSRVENSFPPQSCSLAAFFKIADALGVEPAALIPGNNISYEFDIIDIDDTDFLVEDEGANG